MLPCETHTTHQIWLIHIVPFIPPVREVTFHSCCNMWHTQYVTHTTTQINICDMTHPYCSFVKSNSIHVAACDTHNTPDMTHSNSRIHNDHSHSSKRTAMCDTGHTQDVTHSYFPIYNAHLQDQFPFILPYVTHITHQIWLIHIALFIMTIRIVLFVLPCVTQTTRNIRLIHIASFIMPIQKIKFNSSCTPRAD